MTSQNTPLNVDLVPVNRDEIAANVQFCMVSYYSRLEVNGDALLTPYGIFACVPLKRPKTKNIDPLGEVIGSTSRTRLRSPRFLNFRELRARHNLAIIVESGLNKGCLRAGSWGMIVIVEI
jgi:hypothetical protein